MQKPALLRLFRCVMCLADSRYQYHPLEHYKRIKLKSVSWPKVMLDPDYTFGHHVHDALDLSSYKATVMDKQCIRVLHLKNLFRKRNAAAAFYDVMTEEIDSFHWVLRNPASFSNASRYL